MGARLGIMDAAPIGPATRRRLPSPLRAIVAAAAILLSFAPLAAGKKVAGHLSLPAREAKVVTKFCFDYSVECKTGDCPNSPGLMELEFFGGVANAVSTTTADPKATSTKAPEAAEPELHVALLDDEYFSFPEIREVWTDVNCTDIMKASKKSLPMKWSEVKSSKEESHHKTETRVVEKIRPRWWYVAVVSCAGPGAEIDYSFHLTNTLRGSQSELSMDAQGVGYFAILQGLALGFLAMRQWRTAKEWAATGGQSRRCMGVHPAILLLTLATVAAAVGGAGWLVFFVSMQHSGTSPAGSAVMGRAGLTAAKTLLSILLLLLARGQCVSTPDITWRDHKELVIGLILFGILTFFLETYGESELRNMTTEYIYDTRPGMILVGLSLLWLWLYTSRCWATWQAETRVRPRQFYKRYALPLTMWFASLPLTACIAGLLSPWVRFKITFGLSGLALIGTLGLLVYSFQPVVACKLYELSSGDYEPVTSDELDNFLKEDDEEFL